MTNLDFAKRKVAVADVNVFEIGIAASKIILGLEIDVAVAVMTAYAEETVEKKPEYVGVAKCKMCHNSEKKGAQYKKWSAASHAKAFEVLATAEAKAVASKLGIADAQKSGKCLKCHSTTYAFTESVVAAKVKVEEGVGCESCHGPGSKYKSMAAMKDHDKSVAAGLINPKTACVKCHNADAPSWKADRYTTKDGKKVGFDFEQAWKKVEHDNPNTPPVNWGK